MAREKGVKIIAKIPLDSGWLTGKYNANSTFTGVRNRWSKEEVETRTKLIDVVKSIIGDDDYLSQAAIAFCLSFEEITTVIPGSKTIDQLFKNIAASEYSLSKEKVKLLEEYYQSNIRSSKVPW